MALLSTQVVNRAGITPTYSAVAASDTFVPDSQTYLHIKNAGGSIDNVSVAIGSGAASPIPNITIGAVTLAVPATTGDKMIGPFPATHFADPTTGLATVTHSFTTSVTVAVLKVSAP